MSVGIGNLQPQISSFGNTEFPICEPMRGPCEPAEPPEPAGTRRDPPEPAGTR
jgi:hypothetical protein